jgi:hypothetical protein
LEWSKAKGYYELQSRFSFMFFDANMQFRGTNVNLCVGAPSTPIGESPKMDWGSINMLINDEFILSL